MKKSLLLFAVSFLFVATSCGSEEKTDGSSENNESIEEKVDHDTPEYKLAMVLCDCFEEFDDSDPMAQMDAVGCFLEVTKDEELQNADEESTLKILKDECSKSFENYEKWQSNLDKN